MPTVRLRAPRTLVLAVAAAAAIAATAPAHAAESQITSGSLTTSTAGSGGADLAGGHPDIAIDFGIRSGVFPPEDGLPDGRPYPLQLPKTITTDLPPGLLADPTAVPTCDASRLFRGGNVFGSNGCPPSTQVGLLRLREVTGQGPDVPPTILPLYNLSRSGTEVAHLAAPYQDGSAVIHVDVRVRDESDYGATATIRDIPSSIVVYGGGVDLWGVPGDRSHDDQRADASCYEPFGGAFFGPCPTTDLPRAPFTVLPTRCEAGTVRFGLETYDVPGVTTTFDAPTAAPTGCASLPFAPTLGVVPDSRAAGQPAGYAVDLAVPQDADPDGRATAHVRDVSVTLPEGTAISPSAADGLGACSDAQLGAGTRSAPACPDASRIGSATIDSPLLDAPLQGSIHLGTQLSNDPQSGRMYRVFLVARGSGLTVRLKGSIEADPRTGRLTASFEGNPQVPFDALALRFKGGPRAPLVNPTTCGTKTTRATITSWAGQTATSDSSFVIDQGCPTGAFAPGFDAGTLSPLAGAYSPFTTEIARNDGDQELSRIGLDLPSGLLGDLGRVPVCAEAQAAAGTCGPESRVGSTLVKAGPGPQPYALPGTVSLGGPYQGAPFSLSIAVPAKAGPLDLGLVVVRSPLVVDAANAKVSAPADPLPTIVGGVPLKLRSVSITLDRPGFTFNATSCRPQAIGSTLTGTGGAVARPVVRYQPDGCATLPLKPSLKIAYTGRADLRKGGNPKLTADLGQTFGQAAMKAVRVTLPLVSSLKPENAKALCTPAQDAAGACPETSIVGRASAVTRALHEPVSGPVYFVEGTRRTASGAVVKTLPKLLLKLRGDGVPLDLRADTSVDSTGRLVTTFPNVPDVPLQAFRLEIDGGRNGILTTTSDPCTADRVARVRFDGQNGARTERALTIGTPECGLRAAMNTRPTNVKVSYDNVGAGTLVVSGRGLATTRRTIRSATSATVVARLTAATRRRVAAGRTVRLRLTAAFTPRGGTTAQRVVKTVRVRPAARAR